MCRLLAPAPSLPPPFCFFSRPHQIDRARCRALLQLQSPVVARCRARSRRPSSRRAGRARGIIGCVVQLNEPDGFGLKGDGSLPAADQPRARRRSTRVGPAAKGERGTGFPRAAAGPPLHRQRSQIRLCRSAPLPRDFGPGRSAAASTLGRRCAARWASPFAPAGRWLPEIVVMTHTDGA